MSKKQGQEQQAQQVIENTCLSCSTSIGPSLSPSTDKITIACEVALELKKIDLKIVDLKMLLKLGNKYKTLAKTGT